ncbi:hypothetical protein [Duganella violaceipulchra]|uniref:Uncharacterized protein n=1 Tax=Duganella violaceipulchra TaxID=2849652 RepID=A0AA41HBM8_9BURK|nr:hypothetical protein [Duganella violaceicalia]MBV6321902.1 hypothetical protein [Duganella violaceicalia]MCP2007104.1 hypothetical protein [Duganella violaceicalia]
MSDYATKAKNADATFRRSGQLLTLTYKQPGTYVGGAQIPGVPIVKQAWGIETGVTARDLGVGVINGTLIKSGDRKIMMSALDSAGAALPQMKNEDLVLAGGVTYSVKNVDKVAPGGVVVMWQLVGRV